MKKNYPCSMAMAIAVAGLLLAHQPSIADDMVEAYQLTAVTNNGESQSIVLAKPDNAVGPKLYNKSNLFSVNGKSYDIADIQYIRIEKTMVSAIKEVGCDMSRRKDSMVYNVNGQMVKGSATSLSDLPKGIYIVNGKKLVVK